MIDSPSPSPDPAALAAALSVRERAARLLAGITPGEWTLAPCSHGGAILRRGTDRVTEQTHLQVLPVADAEFIAAAPQLVRDLLTEHDAIAAEHCDVHPHQVLSLMCEECFGEDLSDNAIAWETKVEQLRAEVARLTAEHAAYIAAHEDCVEEVMVNLTTTHDAIESRRDGLEAQVTALRASLDAVRGLVEQWRVRAGASSLRGRSWTFHQCADDLSALLPTVQESSGGGGRTAEEEKADVCVHGHAVKQVGCVSCELLHRHSPPHPQPRTT